MELTIGAGDTTNTIWTVPGTELRVFEIESGDDRTSNYWSSVGTNPSAIDLAFNIKSDTTGSEEAYDIGEIRPDRIIGTTIGSYNSPFGSWWTNFGSSADDKPVAWEYGSGTINNQYNSSAAATDETLGGVVIEVHLSPVADPTNFDSSYDFTDYADITFLEIQGDIYDDSNHVEGEYKTTTRQLSVFIEQGVKVALYSAGTPGTTGASYHFLDLAMHLFTLNNRLVPGTTAEIFPIDTSNIQALSAFRWPVLQWDY